MIQPQLLLYFSVWLHTLTHSEYQVFHWDLTSPWSDSIELMLFLSFWCFTFHWYKSQLGPQILSFFYHHLSLGSTFHTALVFPGRGVNYTQVSRRESAAEPIGKWVWRMGQIVKIWNQLSPGGRFAFCVSLKWKGSVLWHEPNNKNLLEFF